MIFLHWFDLLYFPFIRFNFLLLRLFVESLLFEKKKNDFTTPTHHIFSWAQPPQSVCAISYRFLTLHSSLAVNVYLGSSRRLVVFMLQLVFHALLISRALCVYIYIYIHTRLRRRSLLIRQQQPRKRRSREDPTFSRLFFFFLHATRFSNISLFLSLEDFSPPHISISVQFQKGAWLIRRESWNREWWWWVPLNLSSSSCSLSLYIFLLFGMTKWEEANQINWSNVSNGSPSVCV